MKLKEERKGNRIHCINDYSWGLYLSNIWLWDAPNSSFNATVLIPSTMLCLWGFTAHDKQYVSGKKITGWKWRHTYNKDGNQQKLIINDLKMILLEECHW